MSHERIDHRNPTPTPPYYVEPDPVDEVEPPLWHTVAVVALFCVLVLVLCVAGLVVVS